MSIQLLGKRYVEAVDKKQPWKAPDPKALIEEMRRTPVSMSYVKGALRKLVSEFQKYGAEMVVSDGDVFISIVREDREVLICPIFKDREVFLTVERISHDGRTRPTGEVAVDGDSTYKSLSAKLKKLVEKAVTSGI